MKRRFLSIILTLSMVLAMLSGAAWAAEVGLEEAGTSSDVAETSETAVAEVQVLIDALPALAAVQAMDPDGQRVVHDRTQAAYDAYMALSEEQRGLIPGPVCLRRCSLSLTAKSCPWQRR